MTDPTGKIDFFISYRGQQTDWALWVNWVVRSNGFSTVLMDEFQVGTTWTSNMRSAAQNCRRLIPLYSDEYWDSGACVEEFDAYWAQHLQNGTARFLLPLEIKACTTPAIHQTLIAARISSLSRDAAHAAIVKVLKGITPCAPVTAFAELEPPFPKAAPAAPAKRTASRPHAGPPVLLPTAAARYFGRADLITGLAARLRKDKRTDVWGGPGIGKTALAAEAIASIIGHDATDLARSPFPDGIVFLDLYLHKSDLDSAWHALADAFDDTIPTDTKAADRASVACEKRHALIILEGAEELGAQLTEFLKVIAPENILLVLTRDKSQTTATRRIELTERLEPGDAF